MTEIKPGIPDYIPQFTKALRDAGTPQASIDRFCKYWEALPPHSPALPCPICFSHGLLTKLRAFKNNGVEGVRCEDCKTAIVTGPRAEERGAV
jgi:hypothetical protein